MKKLLILIAIVMYILATNATECVYYMPVSYYYNEADFIFEGTLIEGPNISTWNPNGLEILYRYNVNRVHKGDTSVTSKIILSTQQPSGSCMAINENYLIFSTSGLIGHCSMVVSLDGGSNCSGPYGAIRDHLPKVNVKEELEKLCNKNGLYVSRNLVFDTTSIGEYKNGLPIGNWKYKEIHMNQPAPISRTYPLKLPISKIAKTVTDSLKHEGFNEMFYVIWSGDTFRRIGFLKENVNDYELLWLWPSGKLFSYGHFNNDKLFYEELKTQYYGQYILKGAYSDFGMIKTVKDSTTLNVSYYDKEGKEIEHKFKIKRKKHDFKKLSRFPHLW